jgi:hypothetical protein
MFFDFGNCTNNCLNGHYTVNNINYCKCSFNIKCEKCDSENKNTGLCITCNMENYYYPKRNDSSNTDNYINCYNDATISEGYFLNNAAKIYEPCYSTCKKCSEYGNEIDNKCIECKSGYEFKNDTENGKICYKKCDYYYI